METLLILLFLAFFSVLYALKHSPLLEYVPKPLHRLSYFVVGFVLLVLVALSYSNLVAIILLLKLAISGAVQLLVFSYNRLIDGWLS